MPISVVRRQMLVREKTMVKEKNVIIMSVSVQNGQDTEGK